MDKEQEEKETRPSFICYNCSMENFYNPNTYITKSGEGELLMEMKIMKPQKKKKDVIINCVSDNCRQPNTVTIEYW